MISRRNFMSQATLVGMAGAFGAPRPSPAAEPPPEIKRIRLIHRPSLCEAPNYIAEELLRGEGFAEVQYIRREEGPAVDALASGDADISMIFGAPIILRIDSGDPLVFLSGVHVGCAEVIANEGVRTFRDLKGKRVAITAPRDTFHVFVASIAAHVGLKPETDIQWVIRPNAEWPQLMAEGKIDAVFTGPPQVQELRARKIGRTIFNLLTDRPWSQYYCCMLVGNKDFVRRYPVATKRAMRAILKAADVCSREPERVVRFLVDKGYAQRSDYAVDAMKDVAYGKWREYDAADTVRFYSLRLHEAGLIRSSPQKILAQGTDWRLLNELKKELKG